MYFDLLFNLLKRVTGGSFLFLCEVLVFLFLPFLNLGAQINWYTYLKSALDQPLKLEIKSRRSERTGFYDSWL